MVGIILRVGEGFQAVIDQWLIHRELGKGLGMNSHSGMREPLHTVLHGFYRTPQNSGGIDVAVSMFPEAEEIE